ncbi:hypothetical protein [Ruegeria sp. HKCCSP346]|uniref:hypothetical protein n=1 Tax=Ruegeria sp. HKCCSP346 TaxID=2794830 RepID=UPI001AE5F8AF|nr:hypothetical protein [Ruegeria sp. HKCCSP346]
MDQTLRSRTSMGRLDHYYYIMRTTIFAYVALAAIIGFGAQGVSLVLIVLVIATAAYGILAGSTALADVANLRDDMDEDMSASNFGKGVKSHNMKGLILTSNVLLGLIGLAELIAIVF